MYNELCVLRWVYDFFTSMGFPGGDLVHIGGTKGK
jgi:hypothetical protein